MPSGGFLFIHGYSFYFSASGVLKDPACDELYLLSGYAKKNNCQIKN